MRLVKITGPKGRGADIAKIAFDCGIADVSIQTIEQHKPGVTPVAKEAVDMKVSTPEGRAVIEAVVRAPFYSRDEYTIDLKTGRSIEQDRGAGIDPKRDGRGDTNVLGDVEGSGRSR